eukprot:9827344-Alexandrium_andersonii.AAC.1
MSGRAWASCKHAQRCVACHAQFIAVGLLIASRSAAPLCYMFKSVVAYVESTGRMGVGWRVALLLAVALRLPCGRRCSVAA